MLYTPLFIFMYKNNICHLSYLYEMNLSFFSFFVFPFFFVFWKGVGFVKKGVGVVKKKKKKDRKVEKYNLQKILSY